MCEHCKRIKNPGADMIVYIRSHAPGTGEEFRRVEGARYCPVCGGRFAEPRQMICREMEEWERKENGS